MRVLVTGAAGFIGFHVAQSLLRDGHQVVGLDNFSPYYSVALKRARHALLEKESGYVGFEGDLCDAPLLKRIFEGHKPDIVCHLAAQAGVRYSLVNPMAYQKSNLEGFMNILEACRHAAIPRLVYASSSSVYGGSRKLPFSESDPVDQPMSLYAATKKANELMAHCYSRLYNFQTIGLRFFTVYGPWGRPDMAMWLFTEAMLQNRPIQVFNHGRMSRDFTYIDDIIQGVKASLFEPGLEQAEIINLGHQHPENLMDLIELLARTLGVRPKLEMLPMQPGDVEATYADIERARAKLGFEPRTPIAEGVPKFVSWYRQYHKV